MRVFFNYFFIVLLGSTIFLSSGCGGSKPKPEAGARPAWILNPNYDGKQGAVGVAAETYDMSVSTQRKLAISRALDELALQKGVKVELNMKKEEHLRNQKSSLSIDSSSSYKTTNPSAITAHIEAIWKDPRTGELYVWLVLD